MILIAYVNLILYQGTLKEPLLLIWINIDSYMDK